MHETDTRTSAPARREALRVSIAALAAGVGRPAFAGASTAATPGPDAERIALCGFVVEQDRAQRGLHAVRHTLADEQRTEPALQASYAASAQALDRLAGLPGPFTLAGVRAMAQAAMALAPRDWDGEIMPPGDAEWLAFSVADFLAKPVRPDGPRGAPSAIPIAVRLR